MEFYDDYEFDIDDLFELSLKEYLIDNLFWIFIAFIFMRNILFISIGNYSASFSKLILIAILLITSAVGIFIRRKDKLYSETIYTDMLSGAGIYVAIAYGKFFGKWFLAVFLVYFLIVFVLTVYSLTRKRRGKFISEIRNRKKRKKIVLNRLSKVLTTSGMIFGMLMAVMIIPVVYNRVFNGGVLTADFNYRTKGFDKFYTKSEWALTNNIDEIKKIRTNASWGKLTIQEKLNVLQTIVNCEVNYFGIDTPIYIVADELPKDVLGQYDDSVKTISVNISHLESSDAEEVLKTCLHESYHAWEHELVRLYLDASESQRKLRIFNHCEEYVEEMRDYEDGGNVGSYESFMNYYTQYLEADAREYEESTYLEYYDEIDMILLEKEKGEIMQ